MKRILLSLLFISLLSSIYAQSGDWYVQIGAFDRQVATNYFGDFDNVFYHVDHNDIHRYYLGAYSNVEEAKTAEKQAEQAGFNASVVNLEEVKNSCSNFCGYVAPPSALVNNLHSIFFGFDKSDLRTESIVELDKLVTVLKKYPSYTTVLQAHTDAKGNFTYNQALSRRRAQAARDYLITQGISAARISTRTFGENSPIAKNELGGGKDTELGRQLNRRVELLVKDGNGRIMNMVEDIEVPESLRTK